MKIPPPLATLLLLGASTLLNSCAKPISPPLPPGQSAFNPPVGDPYVRARDWDKYGPGAVIRTPEQTQYLPARLLIGEPNVASFADKNSWTPCSMPKGSTEEKQLISAAANYTFSKLVSAGVDAKSLRELSFSYEFGKTYLSQIPEGQLKGLLSKPETRSSITSDAGLLNLLRRDRARVILGVLIADSVTITAKNSKNQTVDLTGELTPQQKASLGLDLTNSSSKDLSFAEPRFFVYYHLEGQQLRDLKIIR